MKILILAAVVSVAFLASKCDVDVSGQLGSPLTVQTR